MILKIIVTIILSVLAGIAYRFGGSANGKRWVRPFGVALCACLELAMLGYFHWALILCFGAFYGLSTTYFKKKDTDARWFNWVFVGLALSIAVLPIVIVYGDWLGFLIRTIVCTGLIVLWSETNGNAVWEEGGRGIIPIITIPLLLIGA